MNGVVKYARSALSIYIFHSCNKVVQYNNIMIFVYLFND